MAVLSKMIGFVITTNPEKAKAFYGGVLGFRLMSEDNFALVFDANGTMLRVGKGGEFTAARNTVLGWEVEDIHSAIRELTPRGVRFEQFNLPFMKQDEFGVWTPPNGDQVAWFKDPDGNVLSISRHNADRLKG
jgi:catechol 2,3-dioxygenase-like lactoylglutathione lyase family enzyme